MRVQRCDPPTQTLHLPWLSKPHPLAPPTPSIGALITGTSLHFLPGHCPLLNLSLPQLNKVSLGTLSCQLTSPCHAHLPWGCCRCGLRIGLKPGPSVGVWLVVWWCRGIHIPPSQTPPTLPCSSPSASWPLPLPTKPHPLVSCCGVLLSVSWG